MDNKTFLPICVFISKDIIRSRSGSRICNYLQLLLLLLGGGGERVRKKEGGEGERRRR